MKPTSSTKCSAVTSLFQEGYSVHQIKSKTGLGKSIIGRIKKEMDGDKENSKGGRPSKLSSGDKRSIICQITSGSLDNAVEATHFINNTLPNPVTPQTVRNALKQSDFHAVVKTKCPLLKKAHRLEHLKFARYHENWTVED
jgi:transposase